MVREVEQYKLDIVGLLSTHSTGSGTKILERGFFFSELQSERCWMGVGIHTCPRLSAAMLDFSPGN